MSPESTIAARLQSAWSEAESICRMAISNASGAATGPYLSHASGMIEAVAAAFERSRPLVRALDAIQEGSAGRSVDGELQRLMAQCLLAALEPWATLRVHSSGGTFDPKRWQDQLARWTLTLERRSARAKTLLQRYAAYSAPDPVSVDFWARQQRAVAAEFDLELRVLNALRAIEEIQARTEESLLRERSSIAEEFAAQIEWIERAASGVPPHITATPLLSASERTAVWTRQVLEAGSVLPETIELIHPRSLSLPGLGQFRKARTRVIFSEAVERATPDVTVHFTAVEERHRAAIREIDRVRSVVAYGLECGGDILNEAIVNARSLATHYRDAFEAQPRPAAPVQASAAILRDCAAASEMGRLGFLTHLARHGFVSSARSLRLQLLTARAKASGVRWGWRKALAAIQLAPPERPAERPVEVRPRWSDTVDAFERERLPRIYRRLFQLAPVEDPRFLVGREEELRGLASAFDQWKRGEAATVVLIGARGSGKTSLLNCAMPMLSAGGCVIRTEVEHRITTSSALDDFLARAGDLTGGIVILEEVERLFLRVPGGFEAVESLLDRIIKASPSTLWILSLNESAFRYLDAAFRFGSYFTHRINAMAARRDDLRHAILQRHNLSGLRIGFEPPPPTRWQQWSGVQPDAEAVFFDLLYEQSGGVFRSAFELWLDHVERIEAGRVSMRQPRETGRRRMEGELDQKDSFSLHAILQHGGLSAAELSRVLMEPVGDSARRIGRLLGLELIEPDPSAPGYRIKPEARHTVYVHLHQANLI